MTVTAPKTYTLTAVKTGEGETSLGDSSPAAIVVQQGIPTQIVFTADDWHRIQTLTSDGIPVIDATGRKAYTQIFFNVAANVTNQVTFAMATPEQPLSPVCYKGKTSRSRKTLLSGIRSSEQGLPSLFQVAGFPATQPYGLNRGGGRLCRHQSLFNPARLTVVTSNVRQRPRNKSSTSWLPLFMTKAGLSSIRAGLPVIDKLGPGVVNLIVQSNIKRPRRSGPFN